jgi:peroxiredoxin Q/BCP
LNAHVVGVSADKAESQLKFVDKYSLTYPMVPNPAKDIIGAFGVPLALGLAAQRSTFLIDPEGRIAHVWPKVAVKGHATEVIATIHDLQAS